MSKATNPRTSTPANDTESSSSTTGSTNDTSSSSDQATASPATQHQQEAAQEPHTAPQATSEASDTRDPGEEPQGDDSAAQEPENGNREAAKYRRRLRETEIERNALAAKVERYQRAKVLELAASSLSVPEDLLTLGPQLSELLNDDDEVNETAVKAAVDDLVRARPGLAKPAPRWGGTGTSHPEAPPSSRTTWQSVLDGEGETEELSIASVHGRYY